MSEDKNMHDHCDCGCEDDEDDLGTVTLTLDDDTDVECGILAIYPVNGKQYIALIPLDDSGEAKEDADVLIYRFIDNGDGQEPDLENIEADDEYEAAADAFDELLDEDEFADDDDEEDDGEDEDSEDEDSEDEDSEDDGDDK